MDKKRLEAYEKMQRAVEQEYDAIAARMETLKSDGKVKSATYRQLMGQKLTCQNMLRLYDLYGLRQNAPQEK